MTSTGPVYSRGFTKAGALMASIGIIAGAIGSHAVKARFGEQTAATWHVASNYLIFNGIAVLAISGHPKLYRHRLSAPLIIAGAAMFSGGIFVSLLAKPRLRWVGVITPVGGLTMIAGYLSILFAL